jgi:hypothetical protein
MVRRIINASTMVMILFVGFNSSIETGTPVRLLVASPIARNQSSQVRDVPGEAPPG